MKYILAIQCLVASLFLSGQEQQVYTLYFDTDMFTINEQQQTQLEQWLNGHPNITAIEINAYSDQRGRAQYNQQLSEKRARAVADLLRKMNFSSTIKAVNGKGEIPGHSSSEYQESRRAEVIVYQSETTVKSTPDEPKNSVTLSEIDLDSAKVGDKINLSNIIFEGGKRYVLPESRDELEAITQLLLKHNNYTFEIQGHVCCTGPYEPDGKDNDTGLKNLSEMRALQIYQYFKAAGIDEGRMTYKGYGGQFPLGGDVKYDRRVEIEITEVK